MLLKEITSSRLIADKASEAIAFTAVNYRITYLVFNNSRDEKVTWLELKSSSK